MPEAERREFLIKNKLNVPVLTALAAGIVGLDAHATYVNDWSPGDGLTWHLSANESPSDARMFDRMDTLKVWLSGVTIERSFNANAGVVAIPNQGVWFSHGDGSYLGDKVPDYTVTFDYLDADVFRNNLKVKKVYVNNTLVQRPCFLGCSNLQAFGWQAESPTVLGSSDENRGVWPLARHTTWEGVLFDGNMTEIFKYPEGKEGDSYTVPATVKTLGQYCLANTKLKYIHFQGDAPAIEPADKSNTVFKGSAQLERIFYRRGAKGWPSWWCGRPVYIHLETPQLKIEDGYDGPHLSWNEVSYATEYQVQYSDFPDMSNSCSRTISACRFVDYDEFYPGSSRYYRVRARGDDGESSSEWTPVVCGRRQVGRLKLILDETGTTVVGSEYGQPDNAQDVGALVNGVLTIPEGILAVEGIACAQETFDPCDPVESDGALLLVEKLVLPSSLNSIGESAFGRWDLRNLADVTGGDNVTYAGLNAFRDTQFVADRFENQPFEVVYLGKCAIAMRGYSALYEAYEESGRFGLVFQEGTTCISIGTEVPITSVVIPLSVRHFQDFRWCAELEKAIFMGWGGESLKGQVLPETCTIENHGQFNLVHENGRVIGWTISEKGDLDLASGVLAVPDGVTEIESACSGIDVAICLDVPNLYDRTRAVRIPTSVTAIGFGAFDGFAGLASAVIDNPDITVDARAFERSSCPVVTVTAHEGFEQRGWQTSRGLLFETLAAARDWAEKSLAEGENCPLTVKWVDVREPLPPVLIRDGLLVRYDDPIVPGESPAIPSEVRAIGDGCFALNPNLTSVVIPESVTNIGPYAFFGCSNLETVVFHEGLVSIDSGAFAQCVSLGEIALPSSVRRVGDALAPTNAVAAVVRSADGEWQDSTNFVETVDGKSAVHSRERSVDVHAWSLVNRGLGAFDGCCTLTNAILNEGLARLGAATFRECVSLTELDVPQSVVHIGGQAVLCSQSMSQQQSRDVDSLQVEGRPASVLSFDHDERRETMAVVRIDAGFLEGCVSLERVRLPHGLECLGARAFADCGLLREVDLPDSLRALDRGTFCCCTGLERVGLPANLEVIGRGEMPFEWERTYDYDMVRQNDGRASVLTAERVESVADGVATSMVSANGGRWSVMTAEDTDMRYQPEDGVFYGCTALHELELPVSVQTLCDYSFAECRNLQLTFDGSPPTCGTNAVADCQVGFYLPELADQWVQVIVDGLWNGLEMRELSDVPSPATERSQDLTLSGLGWHELSFPVLPEGGDPADVFAPVADKIGYVTYGSKNWNPLTGGTLTALEIGKGYWVQTTAANVSWTVTGETDPTVEIALKPGWNLIGYPLLEEGEVEAVLATALATDKIDYIYSGSRVYPGTLTTLAPGKGYWVYANAAVTIKFDF